MPQLIIGLVGTAGSGKSHAAEYIEKNYDGKCFRFSDYLARILDILAIERSRDNMIKLSVALRREFGEDALAHAVWNDAVNSAATVAIVDGVRRTDDVAALEPLPNFTLIGVDAPAEVRYARNKQRVEKIGDASMTWEHFLELESAPTEVTIPKVMQRAKYKIDNVGTTEELRAKIDALMRSLGVTRHANSSVGGER